MAANTAIFRPREETARELQRNSFRSGIAIELFSLCDFTRFLMSYGSSCRILHFEKVSAPLSREADRLGTFFCNDRPPSSSVSILLSSPSSPPPITTPPLRDILLFSSEIDSRPRRRGLSGTDMPRRKFRRT